jgi:hypothetical protein
LLSCYLTYYKKTVYENDGGNGPSGLQEIQPSGGVESGLAETASYSMADNVVGIQPLHEKISTDEFSSRESTENRNTAWGEIQ